MKITIDTADQQALYKLNAKPVASVIPGAELQLLRDVVHYTFLASCSFRGRLFAPEICTDPD